jgi:AAA15 family ATPase/GTPase
MFVNGINRMQKAAAFCCQMIIDSKLKVKFLKYNNDNNSFNYQTTQNYHAFIQCIDY